MIPSIYPRALSEATEALAVAALRDYFRAAREYHTTAQLGHVQDFDAASAKTHRPTRTLNRILAAMNATVMAAVDAARKPGTSIEAERLAHLRATLATAEIERLLEQIIQLRIILDRPDTVDSLTEAALTGQISASALYLVKRFQSASRQVRRLKRREWVRSKWSRLTGGAR